MRRWICALLAALLVVSCAPAARAAGQPCWQALVQIETQARQTLLTQDADTLAAAYSLQTDRMIRAVQSAPDYVPGSLERHGDFFFWDTTDGRANGYSPFLRAQLCTASSGVAAAALPELPASDGDNHPDNRDVGVFIPYSGSYYFYPEKCIREGQALADSTGGSLRVCTAETTNVDTLAQMLTDCGTVLINSHGVTDYEMGTDHVSKANTSYICLPTDQGFTARDQQPVKGPYGTYRHAFYSGTSDDFDEVYYCVDGTCIANHMQGTAPHSMVWLGFCLGMATEGMYAPLQAKGVEAMIGFSDPVVSDTDHNYRAALCESLLRDETMGQAAEYMKEKVGCPDPYQPKDRPAYPIAVSSQDPYPGRDHLTDGQQVQSTWKLYPAHPIQVTVEPAGAGEAEVVRTQVEVTPHRGYTFDRFEITAGDATALRTGNHLDFSLSGPCAVTVYLTPRTPAAVEFHAGPGQSAARIEEYVGDTVLLPEPQGSLDADAYVYHFLGWTTQALDPDTQDRPALLLPGAKLNLTAEQTDLYAVYGYFAPEDGQSLGQFRRVTQAPESWAGDYVLTYQSAKALRADRYVTGQSILSPQAVASCASAGYFVDGDWLNEVPDEIVYTFLPQTESTGLLKMKTSDNYLAVPTANAMLSTVTDPAAVGTGWRMSWTEDGVRVTNSRFTSRILQYSPTSSGFCTLTTLRGPLTLYLRVPGRHLYTTSPVRQQAAHEHQWGAPVYAWAEDNSEVTALRVCTLDDTHIQTETAAVTVQTTPPACAAPGAQLLTAAFDNPAFATQQKTLPLEALGHAWSDWILAAAPSCTGAGEQTRTCQRCGETESQPLGPLSHAWAAPVYTWAEDDSEVTALRVCTRDAAHTETETVRPAAQVVKPATPQAEGELQYTATFANPAFAPQTKTVPIPRSDAPSPTGPDLPCTGAETCPGLAQFADMPARGTWAHDAIDWAVVEGITNGMGANQFAPQRTITRAQAVTFLWRAAGRPEPHTAETAFADVQPGSYYYKPVLWAVEQGITNGKSAAVFDPEGVCTRGQIVTFLHRFAGRPEPHTAETAFADVRPGSYYYKPILWAVEQGITNGVGPTAFAPEDACTRAQVVTFLYRGVR